MAVNFSELLNADRLRPIWKSPAAASSGMAAGLRGGLPSSVSDLESGSAVGEAEALDPASAPPELLPPETPLQVLDKLEPLLHSLLGPRAVLLNLYLKPLRYALAAMSGQSAPPHPLQTALTTFDLPRLIYQLEDAMRGLLRTTQKIGS